jgi:hypothetical protein
MQIQAVSEIRTFFSGLYSSALMAENTHGPTAAKKSSSYFCVLVRSSCFMAHMQLYAVIVRSYYLLSAL